MPDINLSNPKDPLVANRPDEARELMKQIGPLVSGHTYQACVEVGINLILNTIRQSCKTWKEAEAVFDEWAIGKAKTALRTHYDTTAGKRREVFAFDQVIGFDRHIEKEF